MEQNKKYYSRQDALKILNIHYQTIRKYRLEGRISTIAIGSGRHLYDVEKFIADNKNDPTVVINQDAIDNQDKKERKKICYCRVSSFGQKIELENQINYMKELYPNHEILSDIGSGINFKRPKFLKIIDYAIENQLEELVIAYKDRLCRISYELIEHILQKLSKTKIIIVNNEEVSPDKEVTEDLIQIITVFSSKLYGLRKYSKKEIKKEISASEVS